MNPKDLVKQLQEMGCKHFGILSVDDDVILAQNSSRNITPADIKAQAEKVLNYISKAPNATYVIYGKTSPQSKPTKFIYTKGDEPVKPALAEAIKTPQSEEVLTYSAALKMQNEIAELKADNARLKALVESLEADIEDLENAEPEQMAESPAINALGQLAAILPAVVDKWFENQKEQREIEKQKLYQQYHQQRPQQPRPQQPNNSFTDYDSF